MEYFWLNSRITFAPLRHMGSHCSSAETQIVTGATLLQLQYILCTHHTNFNFSTGHSGGGVEWSQGGDMVEESYHTEFRKIKCSLCIGSLDFCSKWSNLALLLFFMKIFQQ